MSENRTGDTERKIDDVLKEINLRHRIAVANKRKRYYQSKLDPYRTKIFEQYYRDQSLEQIRLGLSSGLLGKSIVVGKTTLHDFITKHKI